MRRCSWRGSLARVDAANLQNAAVWLAQSFQAFQRRCFAGAVGAEQAKDFARLHAKTDVVYSDKIAI